MSAENVNEEKFIKSYVDLTGATESFARCVYMFLELSKLTQNYG